MTLEFCTVETTNGKVRGMLSSGIRQFRGVPYGASTAGSHRFRRPEPPAPWTGVRDCVAPGPVSPQAPYDRCNDYARLIQYDLNVAFGGMGEHCLHLNVWTPGTGRQDRRPVMVSIHGGGFAIGSGNHPMYDGAELAQFGDVVVVSVTHRLSSFGYLNLHDLDPTGRWAEAGVAGMLDLVAALEWVRDNIASFGGDPARVMLFGQSGGGWKVSALLGMRAARGLFHRAAIQSGSLTAHLPREAAAALAHAFIQKLGLTPSTLERICERPCSELLTVQSAIGALMFAPIVDGVHIDVAPLSEAALARSDHVPLIISTTLEDAGFLFDHFNLTEGELEGLLRARYAEKAKPLKDLYRQHWPVKSPFLLHAHMITDSGFRRFAYAQAEAKAARARAPVYVYLWQWNSSAFDGKFGAVHAMDVPASFHNARDPILGSGSAEARRMCRDLASAWVAFARNGDPNDANLPDWPRFDSHERAMLVFDRHTRIEKDPDRRMREFWLDMPAAMSVLG
jgi:para-nitrobenzyl esterase